MRSNATFGFLTGLAIAMAATLDGAQAQTPVTSGPETRPISDAKFVEQASASGTAEVEIGKAAAQKARREEVRKFADQMIKDHQKANDELMTLATERGFAPQGSKGNPPLSSEAAGETQGKQRLMQLSGDDFDRQYMQDQEQDHLRAIKLYEAQAANGQDEKLRQFATAQLPILKHHLEMAQAVNKAR